MNVIICVSKQEVKRARARVYIYICMYGYGAYINILSD